MKKPKIPQQILVEYTSVSCDVGRPGDAEGIAGSKAVHGGDEYFNRRDRKAAESHAALASRGIDSDTHHIHGIATDPFSAVGRRLPVARVDYGANQSRVGRRRRLPRGVAFVVLSLRPQLETDQGVRIAFFQS